MAARWLVGMTAGVACAFVAATLVTELHERAIVGRAEEIANKAMPSVQLLSRAEAELREIEDDLDRFAAGANIGEEIAAARNRFAELLARYASLPMLGSERALFARVAEDRAHLDRSIDKLLVSRGPATLERIHHDIDLVNSSIQDVLSLDAVHGQQHGVEIQAVHERTASLSAVLDGLAITLATLATLLALRQLRRAARILEHERLAREQRAHELVRQNEALGEFAGRVAHDVLSPLATAQLSFDLLRENTASEPAEQRTVDRGVAAIHRVQTLVDDLLAFSRAGGRPDPGVSTDVAPVLADLVAELAPQAHQRMIILAIERTTDGAVACSAGVLASILANLVRNSIKYMHDTYDRRIELRVMRAGDRVRFEVEDTGPGIPPDQQQRIFEPYIQLGRGAGIGLGLATVDRLVRAHGGTLGVRSTPGRGALFWFELPRSR